MSCKCNCDGPAPYIRALFKSLSQYFDVLCAAPLQVKHTYYLSLEIANQAVRLVLGHVAMLFSLPDFLVYRLRGPSILYTSLSHVQVIDCMATSQNNCQATGKCPCAPDGQSTPAVVSNSSFNLKPIWRITKANFVLSTFSRRNQG